MKPGLHELGRLIAVLECSLDDAGAQFVRRCINEPTRVIPFFQEVYARKDNERLKEIVSLFPEGWEFPVTLIPTDQQAVWVGYYQQKSKEMRVLLGEEICENRRKQGMTQKQLAEMSGIEENNVRKIEHGKYNVPLDVLNRVADALGMKLGLK